MTFLDIIMNGLNTCRRYVLRSLEYRTVTAKAKQKKYMYLTLENKKTIITECGDAALILLDYFYLKANVPNFKHTDEKASYSLGWSTRKAKDIRLKLTKAGYFHQATARYPDGRKITTTYLGKDSVKEVKSHAIIII